MTTVAVVPTSSGIDSWTDDEKAVMEFAGLVTKIPSAPGEPVKFQTAPRPIIAAFIGVVKKTGLDPMMKQIYALEWGGKWQVMASIDGLRLTAQRSKEYRGQTAPQWHDGEKWVDVWLQKDVRPAAARVGIWRKGFKEPVWGIASWDEFGGDKSVWKVKPAHMLAKVAESLGLRKAFPMELSGVYSAEEMGSISEVDDDEPKRNWEQEAKDATSVAAVKRIYNELRLSTEFTDALGAKIQGAAVGKPPVDPEPEPGEEPAVEVDENGQPV